MAASPIDVPDLPENKMLVTSPGESDFLIAENGTAKTTIVIPADPSDKVRAAAEDLQSHLNDITGTVIKIGYDNVDRTEGNYILVGPTKQTAAMGIEQPTGYPENERVILKRDKNYVAILGNDDGNFRGTEMAVTMFLEKLGCGWFGTDYLWQVIPEYPTLAVGELDINHTPQFSARGTRIGSQHAKLNIRWYQGGMQVMTGHGLPGMIPIDTYYPSHPEWFALVDGSRDPKTQKWWQYDYSNKELAAEVAKKDDRLFRKQSQHDELSGHLQRRLGGKLVRMRGLRRARQSHRPAAVLSPTMSRRSCRRNSRIGRSPS